LKKLRISAIRAAKQTGAFRLLHEHEEDVLMSLAPWAYRLFAMLLRCASHKTGQGETSYAHLEKLMQPIQPRTGPKLFAPDVQAIKKMIRQLEDRRIISRDKAHSQAEGRLFFMVAPRYAEARPLAELEPLSRTPAKSKKAPIHRGNVDQNAELESPIRTALTTGIQSHFEDGQLSTGGQLPAPPEAPRPPGAIHVGPLLDAARGKIGPPRGPETSPQAGTPPVRPTPAVRAMRAALKGEKIDPPGGQMDAPQGGGAALPPSARIRRPRNAVLNGDAREAQTAPTNSSTPARPMDEPGVNDQGLR